MTDPFRDKVVSDTDAELYQPLIAPFASTAMRTSQYRRLVVYSKSPSTIYHHYDSKDELVATCLDVLLTHIETTFEEHTRTRDGGDAGSRVERALDWLFRERSAEERQRSGVLLQLRAQARHDNRLHDRVTDSEQLFHEYLATYIQQDIEDDVLQSTDPDAAAAFILTTTIGFLVQQTTTNDALR